MNAKTRAEKMLERQLRLGHGLFYAFVLHPEGPDLRYIRANTVFGAMAQMNGIGTFVDPPNGSHTFVPFIEPYPVLKDEVLDLELP